MCTPAPGALAWSPDPVPLLEDETAGEAFGGRDNETSLPAETPPQVLKVLLGILLRDPDRLRDIQKAAPPSCKKDKDLFTNRTDRGFAAGKQILRATIFPVKRNARLHFRFPGVNVVGLLEYTQLQGQ